SRSAAVIEFEFQFFHSCPRFVFRFREGDYDAPFKNGHLNKLSRQSLRRQSGWPAASSAWPTTQAPFGQYQVSSSSTRFSGFTRSNPTPKMAWFAPSPVIM